MHAPKTNFANFTEVNSVRPSQVLDDTKLPRCQCLSNQRCLEWLVFEMTYHVLSGTLNSTHSLIIIIIIIY